MQPPFESHPMIRQFNELKKYFRHYETKVSRDRIRKFRSYAREIEAETGTPVAFDFLGSVNFGQAMDGSDVDMVIYIAGADHEDECTLEECPIVQEIRSHLLRLVSAHTDDEPYTIEVLDCINLNLLARELETGDHNSHMLMRFAVYRSLCRLVNPLLIRPYQKKLKANQELIERMSVDIQLVLDNLVHSSRHNLSFKKYRERIQDAGVRIPDPILRAIRGHLENRDKPE